MILPPGPVPVTFSAGIDKDNLAAAVGLGLAPVTVCSDLLRPGGYGRLSTMLSALIKTMREAGCDSVSAWRLYREREAVAAGHKAAAAIRQFLDGADLAYRIWRRRPEQG